MVSNRADETRPALCPVRVKSQKCHCCISSTWSGFQWRSCLLSSYQPVPQPTWGFRQRRYSDRYGDNLALNKVNERCSSISRRVEVWTFFFFFPPPPTPPSFLCYGFGPGLTSRNTWSCGMSGGAPVDPPPSPPRLCPLQHCASGGITSSKWASIVNATV